MSFEFKSTKKLKNLLLLSIMVIILVLSAIMIANQFAVTQKTSNNTQTVSTSNKINIVPVIGPIVVNGNANFTTIPGVFFGLGTQAQPYVLNGVIIEAKGSTGISISNTDAFFSIQNVLVNGSVNTDAFSLTNVTNAHLFNNTAKKSGSGFSLYSGSTHNILDSNKAINNTGNGFYLTGSSNFNTLQFNLADGNSNGFNLYSGSNNTLVGNHAFHNAVVGIYVWNSANNTLDNNLIMNSANGIKIWSNSPKTFLIHNNASSNNIGYMIWNNDTVIDSNYASQNSVGFNLWQNGKNGASYIWLNNNVAEMNNNGYNLDNSTFIYMDNNTASSNYVSGFAIKNGSHNNTLTNNKAIKNDGNGFDLTNTQSNTLTGNIASLSTYGAGFYLQKSQYNNINYNQIFNNLAYGFYLTNSYYNNFNSNNVTSNNLDGFNLYNSSFNYLFNNTVSLNTMSGFNIHYYSSSNVVTSNLVMINHNYQITIESTASNNNVTVNDILSEHIAYALAYDNGSNNLFNSNYWTNCTSITGTFLLDGSSGTIDSNAFSVSYHNPSSFYYPPCITNYNSTIKFYTNDTNILLSWTSSGQNINSNYTITNNNNGQVLYIGSWTPNNDVIVDVSALNLVAGNYTFQLKVSNKYGSDTAIILVNITQSTTTTPTNTTTPTTPSSSTSLSSSSPASSTNSSGTANNTTSTVSLSTPGFEGLYALLSILGLVVVYKRRR